MHPAPQETHATGPYAHGPFAPLSRFRFMQSEDTMLATVGAWTLGLVVFTLFGFYFGSIAGHDNHADVLPNAGSSIMTADAPAGAIWRIPGQALHKDLDPMQLQTALYYAAAGLAVGVLFALAVTLLYVPTKLRELESEQGHH